ncbi:hypothetical protein HDU96_005593 [Phlyctochytrium bullatum]|nr:hypothetical protein HDU96_005593 [Phlyctochytrium bullatum]
MLSMAKEVEERIVVGEEETSATNALVHQLPDFDVDSDHESEDDNKDDMEVPQSPKLSHRKVAFALPQSPVTVNETIEHYGLKTMNSFLLSAGLPPLKTTPSGTALAMPETLNLLQTLLVGASSLDEEHQTLGSHAHLHRIQQILVQASMGHSRSPAPPTEDPDDTEDAVARCYSDNKVLRERVARLTRELAAEEKATADAKLLADRHFAKIKELDARNVSLEQQLRSVKKELEKTRAQLVKATTAKSPAPAGPQVCQNCSSTAPEAGTQPPALSPRSSLVSRIVPKRNLSFNSSQSSTATTSSSVPTSPRMPAMSRISSASVSSASRPGTASRAKPATGKASPPVMSPKSATSSITSAAGSKGEPVPKTATKAASARVPGRLAKAPSKPKIAPAAEPSPAPAAEPSDDDEPQPVDDATLLPAIDTATATVNPLAFLPHPQDPFRRLSTVSANTTFVYDASHPAMESLRTLMMSPPPPPGASPGYALTISPTGSRPATPTAGPPSAGVTGASVLTADVLETFLARQANLFAMLLANPGAGPNAPPSRAASPYPGTAAALEELEEKRREIEQQRWEVTRAAVELAREREAVREEREAWWRERMGEETRGVLEGVERVLGEVEGKSAIDQR